MVSFGIRKIASKGRTKPHRSPATLAWQPPADESYLTNSGFVALISMMKLRGWAVMVNPAS
jgi:hypothetical protein